MKITQKQLLEIIEEETIKLISERRSWNDDRRDFIARSDLPPEEQTDEELHHQFTEVCKGDVLDQYCKDVHAAIESREEDIMDSSPDKNFMPGIPNTPALYAIAERILRNRKKL